MVMAREQSPQAFPTQLAAETSSYGHKLRQFGAMLDLHRRRRVGHQQVAEILITTDTSKVESSAGAARGFTDAGRERWSVLAGGRDAELETPQTTLGREVGEEFLEVADSHLDGQLPAEVRAAALAAVLPEECGYLFPFIVGQLKIKPGEPLKVNEVAAATLTVEFDQLPAELQRAFGYLERRRLARWVGVAELAAALQLSRQLNEPRLNHLPVRPQLLTMAAIHQLQLVNGYSQEAVAAEVLGWNAEIARRLHRLARRHGVSVNNGVFTTRGTIYQNLPPGDRAYLGLK